MTLAISITLAATFWWAALSVVSRILLLEMALDPWMFTFIQLCTGGAVLLLIGGRKTASFESFKKPHTWILGGLRVVSAALYTSVLAWISVLEAGTIGTISVSLFAIIIWMFSGKRLGLLEWVGHFLIMGTISLILWDLTPDVRQPTTILMLLNAACLVAMNLMAERHPDNNSNHMGVRLRFTGSVLMVTAGVFLILKLAQGELTGEEWGSDIVLAGCLVGILFRAPSMVFAFWSIRLIGALNYTIAVSALPLAGLLIEQVAVAFGLIEQSRFQLETFLLAIVVLAGTFIVFYARRRSEKNG